jgi:hypothetical protein
MRRILTRPELKTKKGIPYSRQHLARLVKEERFPKGFKAPTAYSFSGLRTSSTTTSSPVPKGATGKHQQTENVPPPARAVAYRCCG